MKKPADVKLLPCALQEILKELPPTLGAEEVYSHLENMPAHYWDGLTKADLIFHLSLINEFFLRLAAAQDHGAAPVIRTRHFPKKSFTEVAVCTWDRKGLVSKIAGSLTCAKLDIKKAYVYTRYDHVVLDVFHVEDVKGKQAMDNMQLRKVEAYLTQSLEPVAPLDLEALLENTVILHNRKKWKDSEDHHAASISIEWEHHHFGEYTGLKIVAPDTQGLLFSIMDELSKLQLNIHSSEIETLRHKAIDQFCVTDRYGRKLIDAGQRAAIEDALRIRMNDLYSEKQEE